MTGRPPLDTPESRMAIAARDLATGQDLASEAGFDKFKEALRTFLMRELILARIDEARKARSEALTQRVRELAKELDAVQRALPKEYRL